MEGRPEQEGEVVHRHPKVSKLEQEGTCEFGVLGERAQMVLAANVPILLLLLGIHRSPQSIKQQGSCTFHIHALSHQGVSFKDICLKFVNNLPNVCDSFELDLQGVFQIFHAGWELLLGVSEDPDVLDEAIRLLAHLTHVYFVPWQCTEAQLLGQ